MTSMLIALSWSLPLRASSWDQIGSYLKLIQKTGVEALVANDCPEGLLGAFHQGRQALLMCGNNCRMIPVTSGLFLPMNPPMSCSSARAGR